MATSTGRVLGVNGNMVTVEFDSAISKNDVGYIIVGDERLKGEIIRIRGNEAALQVFEMTGGVKVGDKVEFTNEMLSVELGPGLLQQVYDGLQNPLPELAEQCGFFLQRGVYLKPIADNEWEFTPTAAVGDKLLAGDTFGTVPEGLFTHQIMVPFNLIDGPWTVKKIAKAGTYQVRDIICTIENEKKVSHELSMIFTWPVKEPIKLYEERLRPDETLVTKIRPIDTFLPIAKGGTYCTPGPFGAGKTSYST